MRTILLSGHGGMYSAGTGFLLINLISEKAPESAINQTILFPVSPVQPKTKHPRWDASAAAMKASPKSFIGAIGLADMKIINLPGIRGPPFL